MKTQTETREEADKAACKTSLRFAIASARECRGRLMAAGYVKSDAAFDLMESAIEQLQADLKAVDANEAQPSPRLRRLCPVRWVFADISLFRSDFACFRIRGKWAARRFARRWVALHPDGQVEVSRKRPRFAKDSSLIPISTSIL